MERYKLIDNRLVKAKSVERINGVWVSNPTTEQCAKIEAYPRNEESFAPPKCDEGFHALPDGYEVVEGKWVKKWRVVENPPPPPRVFSKLKVVLALTEAGLWIKVRDYIVAQGLYDLFLAAQDFREDDQYFIQGLTALKAEFSMTDEQVEQILERSVA